MEGAVCQPLPLPVHARTRTHRMARLHAMEGVTQYHARDVEAASGSLAAARSLLARLSVSDEQLAHLQAMGYRYGDVGLDGMCCVWVGGRGFERCGAM
eukprot:224799-Chlamydomonas_euryale.AAC.1